MNILNISNLDKLKITKIKSWAIYFTYDNNKYLLHLGDADEYDTITTLYLRTPINNTGQYKLEPIVWHYGDFIPSIKYKTKKKYDGTLSQIDKQDFVWILTWNNIIESKYSDEITKRKHDIKKIENIKKKLNKLEYELKNEI